MGQIINLELNEKDLKTFDEVLTLTGKTKDEFVNSCVKNALKKYEVGKLQLKKELIDWDGF